MTEELQRNSEHWYNLYKQAQSQLTEKDKQIHDLKNDYEMLDNCDRIHENELKEKDKQIEELKKSYQ